MFGGNLGVRIRLIGRFNRFIRCSNQIRVFNIFRWIHIGHALQPCFQDPALPGTNVQWYRMTDDEFLASFDNCTLDNTSFHHADHVRMAFLFLSRYPPSEALQRFSTSLIRFAASRGKPQRYHETITWAFLLLIGERVARAGCSLTWPEFASANPDLLDWKNNILKRYYRAETLSSDFAKSTFVFPDQTGDTTANDD